MKQSDNPDEFFKKYGFRMSISKPHPKHQDTMFFEGLEASYVSSLEERIKSLETYIDLQNRKIDFLISKEFHKWKAETSND